MADQYFDWESSLRDWIRSSKSIKNHDEDALIMFFKRAFANTQNQEQSWFGVHDDISSLVLGGIFLGAVIRSGQNQGLLLLLDADPLPRREYLSYEPARSTLGSPTPLSWAHCTDFSDVERLVEDDDVWDSYSRATVKILDSPVISVPRDRLQIERGKVRLSEFWGARESRRTENVYPDEVTPGKYYKEGSVKQCTVNAYERSRMARLNCIDAYGPSCYICNFNLRSVYGPGAEGIIHVHHEKPLAEIGSEYRVDPVEDLKPVCPNCHAVIHSSTPAYTVEQVKEMINSAGSEGD